jgi:4-amino-4-deoxychorismate lyase
MRWEVLGNAAGTIDPADRGLQFGDGLFETIAVREGRPRFMDRHLERLGQGCARLGIRAEGIRSAEAAVSGMIGAERTGTAKIIVTRGTGPRGYRPAGSATPTLVVGFTPESPPDPPAARGMALMLCRTRVGRNAALAGLKTLNRLEQVMARMEWNEPDVFEGLMRDEQGLLICGTMSNLFLVRQGRLMTPALARCGVRGIMRGVVLEEARRGGIDVQEADCPVEFLDDAGEVFLTNALIGLRPAVRIGERRYPIGPVTRAVAARLAALGVGEARL